MLRLIINWRGFTSKCQGQDGVSTNGGAAKPGGEIATVGSSRTVKGRLAYSGHRLVSLRLQGPVKSGDRSSVQTV